MNIFQRQGESLLLLLTSKYHLLSPTNQNVMKWCSLKNCIGRKLTLASKYSIFLSNRVSFSLSPARRPRQDMSAYKRKRSLAI